MLNSITEIDRKGLFWTPREPMSPSGNRTAVSRYARACPRPHGRLMLTVLGGLAEFERELIHPRTGEGRKRAKERGVRFGRPLTRANHRLAQPVTRAAHSSGRVAASFRRIGFETSGKTERRFAAERAAREAREPRERHTPQFLQRSTAPQPAGAGAPLDDDDDFED